MISADLFPREMPTENIWKNAINPEFKQESTTNFVFKMPIKIFKTLAKPSNGYKSGKIGQIYPAVVVPGGQ